MSHPKKAASALISVFHKDGLEPIVRKLHELGIALYSTGGTEAFIRDLGLPVTAVEDITGYPSILGGRVKTLHPKVFGGILGRRDLDADLEQLAEYEIPALDMVVVDLYPFERTVAEGASEQEIIEKIDIGGISLIRAAAKNYKDVLCVASMADYDAFLKTHVVESPDGINRVRYGSVSAADKQALDAYVARLEATPISTYSGAEQFAFWVNVYNAATLKMILDHYPVESITDVPMGGVFSFGPWGEKWLRFEGEELSLDDVEHRILRPIWREARIHYAVNCAALGCPNLQIDAFTAANADALMTQGARAFVNHPRGVAVADGDLTVSSIFDWFEEDFVEEDGSVVAHLRKYAEPDLAAALAGFDEPDDDEYDWALNDAV